MKKISFLYICFSISILVACATDTHSKDKPVATTTTAASSETQNPRSTTVDDKKIAVTTGITLANTAIEDKMRDNATVNTTTTADAKEVKTTDKLVSASPKKKEQAPKQGDVTTTSTAPPTTSATAQTATQPAPASTPPRASVQATVPTPATKTVRTTSAPAVVAETPAPDTPIKTIADHSAWDGLLRKYVSADGKVNYAGIQQQMTTLEQYLRELESHPPQSDWSRKERLAYWINVYNAYTVKLIVDNYPVKSITALHGGKPWDRKWIEIDGKSYSLNNIENDLIRPRFKEPRIHFAVNCAAKSCPPLLNRAFTAATLERYLEQQTQSFINNAQFNQLKNNRVTVSKIFDWYGVDFGNLVTYLNKYSKTPIDADASVMFSEYDWSLNE